MAKKQGFVVGAIIGAAVGAVTSLLLAPKSGRELREDIKQKSADLYEQTGDIREKGSEWISIAKDKGISVKDSIVESGKKLKYKVSNSTEDAYDEVEEVLEEYLEKQEV